MKFMFFGSNNQGRHGKGSAKFAKDKAGAIYGQARGIQGNSYAIVTKDLRIGERSIPLKEIESEVGQFIEYAHNNPNLVFYVVQLGCSLAGYSVDEIAPMFKEAIKLENVYLPLSFWKSLGFDVVKKTNKKPLF